MVIDMRRTSLISALVGALLMLPGNAMAATDCYVGAGAGKNLSQIEASDPTGKVSIGFDGFQIGARVGCDIGMGPLVAGAFVGYDIVNADTKIDSLKLDADDYASVGLRAGYKVNDGVLAYGLLGLAAPDFKFNSSDDSGVLYGAGLEIEFGNIAPGLVGYVEWNRIDWRSSRLDMGEDGSLKLAPSTDTIMVGARIKLNVLK